MSLREGGSVSPVYDYGVPVQPDSPWPTFRRDHRNTGRSPIVAAYLGDQPWCFQTGKGVFSTPVIDGRGVVYVGSADHFFYALRPDGSLKWKYETGEIIDSAGALVRGDPATVTFISGDGHMVQLLAEGDDLSPADRLRWKFQAELRPGVSFNRWFEGNVAVGPDGTLYAGNTNFYYYAIHPDGTLKWTYATASNNWSMAAFADDGTIFWGSNDTYIRAVSPEGRERWRRMTLGFIAASAAVGDDGTVYIGSFDSNLYALDPERGRVKWKFPTHDHIYSSAALGQDALGHTGVIYVGSADGTLYAINPDGRARWAFDAGAPIRSSPVVGLSPDGTEIIYFGCGNGKLQAVNADGMLRWSFDTTSADPELCDRNDLNGSPALGCTGIYIGGEHGQVWYVPYDYALHAPGGARAAWVSAPEPDSAGLEYVSPGGNAQSEFPATLPAATLIRLRLKVRRGGASVNARVYNAPIGQPKDALLVTVDPPFPFTVEHSADGRYIYIRPTGFLTPGQTHTLSVRGKYYTGGLRFGNMTFGGRQTGAFEGRFTLRVQDSALDRLPLDVTPERTAALEWTRLAAPLPTMLPSLNQIGFDYMDWIMGVVAAAPLGEHGQGKFILWAIGGKHNAEGVLVADPASDFTLALNGRCQGDAFIVTNRDFKLAITGIGIPFHLFELRGRFKPDLAAWPGPSAWADTEALSIPNFGPYLVLAGLANNWYQKLLVAGTFVTRPYPKLGPANRRPSGIAVSRVELHPPTSSAEGWVEAEFKLEPGAAYPASEHRAGLVLVDGAATEAVYLDYHAGLTQQDDVDGNLQSVRLRLPKRLRLPGDLQVYVMLDVFPVHWQAF
jgi:outer membrane protein assembly factor BamB